MKLESIPIGKMPGRQVIIYNKRTPAIEKKTTYWFKVWEIAPPTNTDKHVWRVEFRAGQKELKDKYNLRSFNVAFRAKTPASGTVFNAQPNA
ncbi:hypothetical protein [Thalassospira lucentensis]|uniref:hypothetical protein n=1 Tax=Thalassospira lucentensis TaxID=168935 RepID=UPI0011BDF857|nr:hypothetical protein [Thalassospira lucentensis]